MDRTQKTETVEALHNAFKATEFITIAHYSGLTVAEITDLRRKMLTVGASFRVAKNRLAKIALKDTPYEALNDLFTGPTGIAFSADPVSAAKVLTDFAKGNEKFVVLGGGLGARSLDRQGVEALAKLPSLDVVRAGFLGILVAPATRVATVLQAPASQLARVMKAYAEKDAA